MPWFRRPDGRHGKGAFVEAALARRLAGIGIGVLVVGLVLGLRGAPGVSLLYRTIELKTLDLRFRLRPSIPEDPRIVNIDVDDRSLRNLRLNFPLTRTEYARTIGTLRRLGARRLLLDVMFRDATERSASPIEGGRLELASHDENLAAAIAAAGNVYLAWSFSDEPLPPGAPADLSGHLAPIVMADLTRDAADVARRAGVDPDLLAGSFEALRGRILKDYLVDAIRTRPAGSEPPEAEAVLKQAVPGFDPDRHAELVRRVRDALDESVAIEALDRGFLWPCSADAAHPEIAMREIVTPLRPLIAGATRAGRAIPGAAGAGFVNDYKDREDGVLRRILPLNVWKGRAYPHLAFRAAFEALGATPDRIVVAPRRSIQIDPGPEAPAGRAKPLEVPLTAAGELLVNWAGSGRPGDHPFVHIPVGALLMLDRAGRDVGINSLLAFDRVRGAADFLGGKFPAVLPAADREVSAPLRALIAEAAAQQDQPQVDAYARMERDLRLREHADWMLGRVAGWAEKIRALLPAAEAQKKLSAAEAEAVRAALAEAEAIVRDFVVPYRAREEEIHREVGDRIRGATCIVGAGGTGHDLHSTPLYQAFPGPWVLSNVLNMFYTDRFLREAPAAANVAAILLCGLLISLIVTGAGPIASTAAALAGEAAWFGFAYVLFARHGLVVDVTGPMLVLFLAYAFITAYRQLIEGRDRRRVREIFGLFVSDQVLGEMLRNPKAIALGGQKRAITVFFSDVAGFTAISEKLDPADQIRFMNDYLTAMSHVIMACGGYINKYIGDGILALFGAPLPGETHAADAARAAAGCLDALGRLNVRLASEGKPPLRIRIGLSTGEVVVGLVGALGKKLEYTAMGDVVNLGARLEAASKPYKTTVLMSDRCREQCGDAIVAREVDLVRVPGKTIPVRAYELMGLKGEGVAAADDGGFLAAYESALAHYKARRWIEAEAGFRRCLELKPADGPSAIYAERCARFQASPPPGDWDGVAEVTVK